LLTATTGKEKLSELPIEIIDFEASAETDDLDMSLSKAIGILRDHGLEPNEYLDTTSVEDFTVGYAISTTFSE